MSETDRQLPPITVLIEWENAIDVEDEWAKRAMAAFEGELESVQARLSQKPRVMYLYDETAVSADVIRGVIETVAPRLTSLADVEFVATPGLSYYKLKNYGVSRTDTELVIMLDSDAGPKPGWLEALLKPFSDPEVMAVGGFTMLGHEDLLSRTMALSWIFDLPSEKAKSAHRRKIHANNCAFRTAFIRENPFPDLPTFKKACGFWLRDIDARGYKWVRTVDAMTVHAPHPGYRFITWRAWTAGLDRDFEGYHTVSKSRLGRLGFALTFAPKKLIRSWSRIITKGGEVGLPVWQRPLAMGVALYYFSILLAGHLTSAATRSFGPLPDRGGNRPPLAAQHG